MSGSATAPPSAPTAASVRIVVVRYTDGRLTAADPGGKRRVDVHSPGAEAAGSVASPGGEDEVPSIRERVARSVRDRAREGKQPGGHRRFGWLPADRQLARPHNHELDQREATYLRAVIGMALSGKSERTLTQWLISEGVTTVKGGRWTSTTARNMITNPAICGYRALDGAIVLDPELGEPKGGRLGDDRHA